MLSVKYLQKRLCGWRGLNIHVFDVTAQFIWSPSCQQKNAVYCIAFNIAMHTASDVTRQDQHHAS